MNLSKNDLGEKTGEALKIGLEENISLKILDLSWNKLRAKSLVEVSTSLQTNKTLSKINLSWNGFDDRATAALGNSLAINKSLENLNLTHNRISSSGAKDIALGLSTNRKLESIFFKGNPINPDGVQSLLEACMNNDKSKIKTINLEGIWISEQNKEIIGKLAEQKADFVAPVGGYLKSKESTDIDEIILELIDILKQYVLDNHCELLIYLIAGSRIRITPSHVTNFETVFARVCHPSRKDKLICWCVGSIQIRQMQLIIANLCNL